MATTKLYLREIAWPKNLWTRLEAQAKKAHGPRADTAAFLVGIVETAVSGLEHGAEDRERAKRLVLSPEEAQQAGVRLIR